MYMVLNDLSVLNNTTQKVKDDIIELVKNTFREGFMPDYCIVEYKNIMSISVEAYEIFKNKHPILNYLYFENKYLKRVVRPIIDLIMKIVIKD